MVRNDTDSMICFYGVNKCCIDGLECLETGKKAAAYAAEKVVAGQKRIDCRFY